MGRGYRYICKKCGYVFSAHLGVGFRYPQVYQETMKDAREGKLGEKVRLFLKDNPKGVIDPELVIARCEDCGKYETLPAFSMYVPKDGSYPKPSKGNWTMAFPYDDCEYVSDFGEYDLKEKYDHKCTSCGGKMSILEEKEPETLICPHCGEDMEIRETIMWD